MRKPSFKSIFLTLPLLLTLLLFTNCSTAKHSLSEHSVIGKWKVCSNKKEKYHDCELVKYEEFLENGNYASYKINDEGGWDATTYAEWSFKKKKLNIQTAKNTFKHHIRWINEDMFSIAIFHERRRAYLFYKRIN